MSDSIKVDVGGISVTISPLGWVYLKEEDISIVLTDAEMRGLIFEYQAWQQDKEMKDDG